MLRLITKGIAKATQSLPIKHHRRLTNHLLEAGLAAELSNLMKNGLTLDVIYDIGANKGEWSRRMRGLFPNATFIMFEANPAHGPILEQTGLRYLTQALAAQEEERTFYSIDGTGDSFYRETSGHYDGAAEKTLRTARLDAVMQQQKLPPPDLVKIDTQGSELDILEGMGAQLDTVSLLFLECPVLEYNAGAPTFAQYMSFLEGHGFYPLSAHEHHNTGPQRKLSQIDILFAHQERVAPYITP